MTLAAPVIEVVAALIVDGAGRMLLVRKRGTNRFMQAGGKPDPGESSRRALVREVAEELSLDVDEAALVPLGRFETAAANEAGHLVRAEVFRLRLDAQPVAAAEIEEARWCTEAEALALGDHLAPLARILLAHMRG